MAVVPSNPDRFSRLIPVGSSSAVSMTGVSTIPQLAIASRLQEYKDLLGAGGSRYSDWLETFFASKIEHVDRPKLLFSASQTVNVQIVMNQSGANNFGNDAYSMPPLGQQGGSIVFNDRLGRRQSYYFREPGYMIDMLSIRPVYYWASITPDYLSYQGADYFNPIYMTLDIRMFPYFALRLLPLPLHLLFLHRSLVLMNSGLLTMKSLARFLGFKARLVRALFTLIGSSSARSIFSALARISRITPFCS